MVFKVKHILFLLAFCFVSTTFSQNKEQINWLTWEQLDIALKEEPKPVFMFFHANWCVYCKKIKRKVFTNETVIQRINKNYYALEMDVESTDTIVFDGATFVNSEANTKRRSVHDLAQLLASRKNRKLSLPVTLVLDENFMVKNRIFEYYSSKQLLSKL